MIYFIEGFMGVGKTTYATKLFDELTRDRKKIFLYYEHMSDNQLDFTRKAVVTKKHFEQIEKKYYEICSKMNVNQRAGNISSFLKSIKTSEEKIIVAFAEWNLQEENIRKLAIELSKYEICNGLVNIDEYFRCLKNQWNSQWKSFGQDSVYIFEGALLQNIILDLLGFYNLSDEEIVTFYRQLLCGCPCEDVKVVRIISKNIENILNSADKERNGNNGWLSMFEEWLMNSNYAKEHSKEKCNVVSFCGELQRIEELVIKELMLNEEIVERM